MGEVERACETVHRYFHRLAQRGEWRDNVQLFAYATLCADAIFDERCADCRKLKAEYLLAMLPDFVADAIANAAERDAAEPSDLSHALH
jgi:hypothetical protein